MRSVAVVCCHVLDAHRALRTPPVAGTLTRTSWTSKTFRRAVERSGKGRDLCRACGCNPLWGSGAVAAVVSCRVVPCPFLTTPMLARTNAFARRGMPFFVACGWPLHGPRCGGMMSNDPSTNPITYDWNKVLISYCDGASYSGNNDTVQQVLCSVLCPFCHTRPPPVTHTHTQTQ